MSKTKNLNNESTKKSQLDFGDVRKPNKFVFKFVLKFVLKFILKICS